MRRPLPLILLIWLTSTVAAQDIRFEVKVSTCCGELDDKLLSYAKRELRSLGDVEVDNVINPDYNILLIAAQLTYTAESSPFYVVVSFTVSEYTSRAMWEYYGVKADLVDDVAQKISLRSAGMAHKQADQLGKLIEEIITTFDTDILEPERASRRDFNKMLRESQDK